MQSNLKFSTIRKEETKGQSPPIISVFSCVNLFLTHLILIILLKTYSEYNMNYFAYSSWGSPDIFVLLLKYPTF